jgi:predicted transcriptional regulator
MKKMNNLLSFKEYTETKQLKSNTKKAGKVVENVVTDKVKSFWKKTKKGLDKESEEFKKAEKEILNHPNRREVYNKIKGTDKGYKYVKFFIDSKFTGYPRWDDEKQDWDETGVNHS